jgi:hypothetical protein
MNRIDIDVTPVYVPADRELQSNDRRRLGIQFRVFDVQMLE